MFLPWAHVLKRHCVICGKESWTHSKDLCVGSKSNSGYYYKVDNPHFPQTSPASEQTRVAVGVDHVTQDDVLTHFSVSRLIVHVPTRACGCKSVCVCVHKGAWVCIYTCTGCAHLCRVVSVHVYACMYSGIPGPMQTCRSQCSISAGIQEAPLFTVTMETKRQSPSSGRT